MCLGWAWHVPLYVRRPCIYKHRRRIRPLRPPRPLPQIRRRLEGKLRPPCRSRLDSNLKAPRRANCQRLRVVCHCQASRTRALTEAHRRWTRSAPSQSPVCIPSSARCTLPLPPWPSPSTHRRAFCLSSPHPRAPASKAQQACSPTAASR